MKFEEMTKLEKLHTLLDEREKLTLNINARFEKDRRKAWKGLATNRIKLEKLIEND